MFVIGGNRDKLETFTVHLSKILHPPSIRPLYYRILVSFVFRFVILIWADDVIEASFNLRSRSQVDYCLLQLFQNRTLTTTNAR